MRSTALRSASAITAVIALAVAGVDGLANTAINNTFSSTAHSPSSFILEPSYGLVPNVSVTAHNTTTPNAVTVLQTVSVCASSSNTAGSSGSTFSSRPLIGSSYGPSLSKTSTTRASTASDSSVRLNTSISSTPKSSLIARANEPAVPDDRGIPVGDTIIYSGNSTSTIINVGTGSSSPLIKTPAHTAPGSSSLIAASTGNSPSTPATRSTPAHTFTRSSSTTNSTGSTSSTISTIASTSTRRSSTKESFGLSTPGHSTSPATTEQSTNHGEESGGESAHSGTPSTTVKGPGTWYPGITGLPHVPTITPGPISTSFTGPVTANHTMLNATTTTTAHNATAPVWIGSIRKHEAESKVSSVSTYFLKILPTISDWELKPDPPLQTDMIKKIKGFEDHIKDLGIMIDPKWKPECPPVVKRGLVDGLIDSVTNVVKTGVGATTSVLSALGCIDDNTKRLINGIENRNTETVKGIVDTLTKSNPPKDDKPKDDDPEDDENPSSSATKTSTKSKDEDDHSTTTTKSKDDDEHSTTTTKTKDDDDHSTSTTKSKDNGPPFTETTTTCTKHTAHHVTVLCSPTLRTMGTMTKTSTMCSPTTTSTTTGCSASDTTTTVTATPTEASFCSPESCGKACSNGKGGWVTVGPVDCEAIPTKSWTLPAKSQATAKVINANPKAVRSRDTSLSERQINSDPLPGFTNFDLSVEYVTGLAKKITNENQWISQIDYTTGKWYKLGDKRLAAGVKPLHGCTAVFIVSREGVYVSHIYESPVFVTRNEQGSQETSDHEFRLNTIQALTDAVEWDYIDPLSKLVGTDAQPGPLHRSLSPHLIIITRNGDNGGLEYARQVKILSDGLCAYLYSGSPCPANTHYDIGYDPVEEYTQGDFTLTPGQQANNDDMLVGKAIFEMTPLGEWVPADDWNSFTPVGSWRLWIQGQATSSVLFWNPKHRVPSDGGLKPRANDEKNNGKKDDDGEYTGPCAKSNNGYCSKGSCGTSCQGGSGGWLDLGKIDCAKIPVSTLSSLPSPTNKVSARDYQLKIRADNNPPAHLDPLPPLPPPPDNLNPAEGEDNYIHQVSVWFDQQNLWLNLYGPTETTFEWIPFQSRKSAVGMKGLTGCVGLFIVSARGVFMAHFWEHPTLVMGIRNDKPVYSLPGDINRDIINVLRPEITRLVESGDLHPAHHPKIFLISPFRGYESDGPLLHMQVLEQIGPQIDRLIYPEGMAHETIKLFGYRRTTKEHSNDPTTPWGKLIMEGTPLTRWYEGPRGYIPVGHVRFWVGGKLMIDQDFWSPKDASDAGFGQTEASTNQADDDDDDDSDDSLMVDMDDWNENGGAKRAIKKRAGVCPMPTKTKTSTKSTSKSTSKTATTSTKSTTKLPLTKTTKTSTTTTSTTSTTSTTKSSTKVPVATNTKSYTTKTSTTTSSPTSIKTSTTKSTTKTSSTKSTTKKPSTFATSTKSKPETNTKRPGGQPPGFTLPTYQPPKITKTKQEANTKNPGGQPPGFNLPTYDPPKTTKTTTSDKPGPTYPLGEPPDDLDMQIACEIRQYGNGHMPEYNRELYEKITNMCTDKISDKNKNFDKDSKAISWTANTDDKETYYYAEVGWSRGCEGEKKTVNVLKPKKGLDCKTLLRANFQGCRTPSFGGGTTTIGCISYKLRQGKDGN
ncbi:hypothetical protein BDV19DRAFT_393401 [Aspergillus venezuelensis]